MSIYATQWVIRFPAFGDLYDSCEWVEVIGQGALRGNRPQLTMEVYNNGRHLLMFDDGSTRELGFTGLIPDGIRWLATLLGIRKRHG